MQRILLSVLTGVDPRDRARPRAQAKRRPITRSFLKPDGLRGARIGVARKYFGFHDAVDKLMKKPSTVMKQHGAIIVDPADLPTHGKFEDSEFTVLLYELKADLECLSRIKTASARTFA